MDANKIKFVDDGWSVEVLAMTARVHVETPTEELIPQETIEEEQSSSDEDIVLINSSVEGVINSSVEGVINSSVEGVINSSVEGLIESVSEVSGASGPVIADGCPPVEMILAEEQVTEELQALQRFIEGPAIEQHDVSPVDVKEIEDNVLLAECAPDIIKMDEVKAPEQEYTLSLVANTHASEHNTPKGCCILQ